MKPRDADAVVDTAATTSSPTRTGTPNRIDGKPRPNSIVATLRKCIAMVPATMHWRWALLAPVSVMTGIVEAGAAAAVFCLLKIINDPAQMTRMPVTSLIVSALPRSSAQQRVLIFTGLIALYYLLKNLIVMGAQYLRHKIAGESIAALKSEMLRRYLGAPYLFHLARNSADLIWSTNFCAEMVCGEVMTAAVMGSSEILTAAAITGFLLYTAPKVTLIAGTLLVLVLAVLLRLTRRMAERLGSGRHDLERASLRVLQEGLGGIKEIKALGREQLFYRKFRDQQREVLNLGYIGKTLENIVPLITETIFVCGALAVVALVTGVEPARTEGLPLLALFGYAAFRIVPAANRITWQITRVRSAGPAVDSLYRDYLLLTDADLQAETDANGSGIGLRERIVLEHVTYIFPETETPALQDICLEIGRGESIGIVGQTGAGKTTLIDLVVGLLQPTSGRICVDGIELSDRLASWRRCVGYVPQTVFLTDESLRRNITLGIEDRVVDGHQLAAAVKMAQLEGLVAALPRGLDTPVGERGVRLSGGERQRVGIARALYHNPDLLIFDEATSALDHSTEAAVNEAIESLHRRKTVLVVAHRLSSVRRCDRVVFLSNGRVKACGSYDDLVRGDEEFRRFANAHERVDPPSE